MKRRWNRALALMVALLLTLAAMAMAEAPGNEIETAEADVQTLESVETEAAFEAVKDGDTSEDETAIEADEDVPEVTAESSDPTMDETEFDLDDLDAEPIEEEPAAEEPAGEESDAEKPVEEESDDGEPAAEEGMEEEQAEEETAEEENAEEAPAEGGSAEDTEDAVEPTEETEGAEAPEKTVALPTANALTYNGQAQPLVSGEGWLYAMDGEDYDEAIPTAVDAGEYTVYCIPAGDAEAEPLALTTTIAKADVVLIAPVAAEYEEG